MQDYARYIPHTDSDVREMLKAIGVKQLEDLFQAIPRPYRLKEPLKLPQPLSEPDLLRHLQEPPVSRFLRQALDPLSGSGSLPSFHPGRRSCPHLALRILYRLYALSARDQPGHAPGHLRVPDAHVSIDRHGGLERLHV